MSELPPPEDDGLHIDEVREWATDKHHFLLRYIRAFTTAMKDKKWDGLHYVDLFAGPGILKLESSGKLEWGSPLIAVKAPDKKPFDGIHVCEKDSSKFEALRTRLERANSSARLQALQGDANDLVGDIVSDLPSGALTLAFLDPYGLHLNFETLRTLANRRCDLVIFFPDRVDVLRNWERHYLEDPKSNLDRTLGPGTHWREQLAEVPKRQHADCLRKIYVSQIGTLGYKHFDYERISNKDRPLYILIYCSKDRAGAKIWRGTAQRKPDGQGTFGFEDPEKSRPPEHHRPNGR